MNMTTAKAYEINLKDGEILRLEPVLDKNADLSQDQALGVSTFVNAFKDNTPEDIEEHFESPDKIADYYQHLISHYDVGPFREGKLLWVRAFLHNNLIGWMGIEPHFRHKNHTYLSTFILDPKFEGKGIGKKMLSSIVEHWLPETTEINLIVRKINHKALEFYQHIGFIPAEDIDHHYNDNPRHCLFLRWVL